MSVSLKLQLSDFASLKTRSTLETLPVTYPHPCPSYRPHLSSPCR